MAIVLFDSNILIDHVLGIKEASAELAAYEDAAISTIGWMETACMLTPEQVLGFDRDLENAGIVTLQTTASIMRKSAIIRGQRRGKLPDCIIWATAEMDGRLIVTRDPNGFGGTGNPMVRVPYKNTAGVITDVMPLPS